MLKKIICALLVAAIFTPATALADDSSLGGEGETVYPVSSTDIVMEKEIIDINVLNGRSYYSCRFYFKNTGDAINCLTGFPSLAESIKQPGFDNEGDYYDAALHRFKTYINGKRVNVRLKYGMKKDGNNTGEGYYPVWYTFKVPYKAGEAKRVTNTYWCSNTYDTMGGNLIQYVLKTGAYWKDAIGSAVIRMKVHNINPLLVNIDENAQFIPINYTQNGTLIWSINNVEPKEDIDVYIENPNLEWLESLLDREGLKDDASWFEGNSKAFKDLKRLISHFDKKHFRSAVWWGNRIRKQYKDKAPNALHFYMGVSYYTRHLYQKAIAELEKCGDAGIYYTALAYQKLNKAQKYRECLNKIAGYDRYPALKLWAQSRIKDLGNT